MAHIGYPGSATTPPAPPQTEPVPVRTTDGILTEYLEQGLPAPIHSNPEQGSAWKRDILRGHFHQPYEEKAAGLKTGNLPADPRLEPPDQWKHEIVRGHFHAPAPSRHGNQFPVRNVFALMVFILAAVLIIVGVIFMVDHDRKGTN